MYRAFVYLVWIQLTLYNVIHLLENVTQFVAAYCFCDVVPIFCALC